MSYKRNFTQIEHPHELWQSNQSQGEISDWSLIPAKQNNYTMKGQKPTCVILPLLQDLFTT